MLSPISLNISFAMAPMPNVVAPINANVTNLEAFIVMCWLINYL